MYGGDPALRQRLAALLAAHDQPETLLATQAESARPTIKLDLADTPDEAVGQTLGRYKLLERVGEGGCGVVYVAEQTDPVRRRVALKLIKLGMDTKQVVARFEAERQALAMMDHPNIAKVLDAGMTESSLSQRGNVSDCGSPPPLSSAPDGPTASKDWRSPKTGGGSEHLRAGRPYFVMEPVRGIRITDYCDQASLSTKERLDLFIKVCHAIQHAHQKGIIHREIKPSNILVTLHDGVPAPPTKRLGRRWGGTSCWSASAKAGAAWSMPPIKPNQCDGASR
jgi:serine/threonine protein kinase